jgi:hypothetical protein
VASAIVNPAVSDAQTRAGSAHSLEHVRSSDDILASTMRTAAAQSATFRALVSRVDASDGIVYVEPGTCRRGPRACLIRVSPGGANRFFRVHVETNRPEWDLIGAIAHELWHVIEVVGDRGVRDNAAMHLFYDRQGLRTSSGFETREAIRAGDQVRSEVRQAGGRIQSRELVSVQ